jgi:tuftelin-interacting protein 11
MYEASLDTFTPNFEKLLAQYTKEYERYQIDEIVVAAIAPVVSQLPLVMSYFASLTKYLQFRRMLAQWNPLEDPAKFTDTFRMWRGLLRTSAVEEQPRNQVDLYGTRTVSAAPPMYAPSTTHRTGLTEIISSEKPMTPYESLLWNAWLPKIRSCINNEWSALTPDPLVRLYEAWASLLPPFVRDNFFDQLVLPKVQKAVADWNARRAQVSLRTLVFPWLPHVGLRVEGVLDDAKRKVKSVLRAWVVDDGMPEDLASWREVRVHISYHE